MTIRLHSYWRSSAAYRVRIALGLKGLAYETVPVHLVRDGGEQHTDAYRAINPQALVPSLEHDGHALTQSLAIIEYLDEVFPEPALLPRDPLERARDRSLAHMVAMDIHPLDNLRVLKYLSAELGVGDDAKMRWYRHWIDRGFEAIEARLAGTAGDFASGAEPGLADICLVPQVYNARRFDVDLGPYPSIATVDAACLELDAFRDAAPEAQPDAVS